MLHAAASSNGQTNLWRELTAGTGGCVNGVLAGILPNIVVHQTYLYDLQDLPIIQSAPRRTSGVDRSWIAAHLHVS